MTEAGSGYNEKYFENYATELDDGSRLFNTRLYGNDGNPITSRNPIPIADDSVYVGDIDLATSAVVGFSGSVLDIFKDVTTTITNTTATNPKAILISFNRTIITDSFGLGTITGSFSNIKIQGINSGLVFTTLYDGSADNTARTTLSLRTPNVIGIVALYITFHTANPITLGNMVILKRKPVVSKIQMNDPSDAVVELLATAAGNAKVSLEEFGNSFLTNPIPVVSSDAYVTKIDVASATITYIGIATPGTLTSVASWQIKRIDTSTLAADILFADGDNAFNNIWDNRAALSYS